MLGQIISDELLELEQQNPGTYCFDFKKICSERTVE
jgi:hypothetical protein